MEATPKGLELKLLRIRAGIRQYRLAAALGIPQAILSYWENNRREIPPDMEQQIVRMIGELKENEG